jgi:subtilisin family serine protease
MRELGDPSEDGSSGPTHLTVEDLEDNDVAEIGRDPRADIAPVMPTKLVRPLDLGDDDGADIWGIAAVGADTCGYTGKGVRVAVLDTGIEEKHPTFQGVRFTTCDFTGTGIDDRDGHGTHCAGTIFGREISGKRIGVAPGVETAFIGKVLRDDGSGTSDMIFTGLRWAIDQKCDVISLSLGLDFPGQVESLVVDGWPVDLAASMAIEDYRKHSVMFEALMGLARARVSFGGAPLVVAASGNESRRNQNPKFRMATSLPGVVADISVGAVERTGSTFGIGFFSNAYPTVVAPGVKIVSAALGGGLKTLSGTSMACPHVAGVAALWAEKLRNDGDTVTAEVLFSHITARARRDVFAPKPDEADVGRGLVTAPG